MSPRAETRDIPLDQPHGRATQQRGFIQQTTPQAPPQPQRATQAGETDEDGLPAQGFDPELEDALLFPTQRPDESVLTLPGEQPLEMNPEGPNPDIVRLAQDPTVDPGFRAMMRLSIVLRGGQPGATEF